MREEEAFRDKKKQSQRKRDNFKNLKSKFEDKHKPSSYEFAYEDARYPSAEATTQSSDQVELSSEKQASSIMNQQDWSSSRQTPAQIDLNDYLNSNNQVDVLVSAVADPTAFWIQVADLSRSKLTQLDKQMSEFYSEHSNEEHLLVK